MKTTKILSILTAILVVCAICISCDPDNIINNNPNLNEEEETSKYTAVDLGLSVKWATFNVGATSPEEFGDYFCWGETTPNSDYWWHTYKWCEFVAEPFDLHFTKYFLSNEYPEDIECTGKTDYKSTLDLSNDAAAVNWGGNWRMPTESEIFELYQQCDWMWTFMLNKSDLPIKGVKITGPNGNSIFLPAAGYRWNSKVHNVGEECDYWSSSLVKDQSARAWDLYVTPVSWWIGNGFRCNGFPVRPVCPNE